MIYFLFFCFLFFPWTIQGESENQIKEKIEAVLEKDLGHGNYYTQTTFLNNTQPLLIYIVTLVDKHIQLGEDKIKQLVAESLKEENLTIKQIVHFSDLNSKYLISKNVLLMILCSTCFFIGLGSFVYKKIKHRKKTLKGNEVIPLSFLLKNASPKDLAAHLYSQPLRTVALILFHLSPVRATAVLSEWSKERQGLILMTFDEMQREEKQALLIQNSQAILELPESPKQTFATYAKTLLEHLNPN